MSTKTNIILADATVIEVAEAGLEPHFVIEASDRDAFLSVWDKFTEENLSELSIMNDGKLVAVYENCKLIGTQTINQPSFKKMVCHFYLTGTPKDTIDPDYKTAYNILAGGMN